MKRFFYLLVLAVLGVVLVSAQDEQVWLYGGGVYKPGDRIRLEYNIPPGTSATLGLYRILNPEKVLELGGPQSFQGSEELSLKQINNVSVRLEENRYWGEATFNNLAPGMYFAQLEGKSSKSATLILVSDLSMVVKSDQNTILAYTASSDGTPRKAKVYLLRQGEAGGIYAEGLANDQGLTEFTKDLQENLMVAAKFGETWAFSSSYWSQWGLQKTKVYLQTDRPVYRPGHMVLFKGTARSASNIYPLVNQDIAVVISDSDGNEIYNETLKTDAYGSFNGELKLSAAPPLGYYSLVSTIDNETSYANFEVQEFQKPEYRVTVTPDKTVAIQGDKAIFTIKGEYLFGGAVTGGKVSYAVTREPYYRWYSYYFDYFDRYYYGGDVIIQGEGVLNEKGELVVEVPLDSFEQDYQLTLQAGVTDEARREISGSSSITVYRSGIVLNVSTERYAYKAGDTALVTVRAEDIEGNPVSVPFVLDTERYFWESNGSRSLKGQSYRGETGENGEAVLNIPFERQGSYTLTATAKDSRGRETQASAWVWVSGSDRWYWAYDGLSLRPDKSEYKMGDTARVVVQSPIADAYALVTHEGQEISKYEMIKLNGSVLTYEFTITEAMAPNHYVGVTIIGNDTTYYDTVNLVVPPSQKYLNVEITSNADVYKPGEEGTFSLRVSDPSGKGVRSQLTLGIVDEGIYLVRPENTPNIKDIFYAQKSNLVGTDLSDWFYFGSAAPLAEAEGRMMYSQEAAPAPMARAAMDEAVFAQSKAAFAEADVREDFRDTILWLPTLETDDNGLATAKVTFPDNLTEWRVTARAISRTDQVGQNTYSVKTSLPVIARLAMPRFLIRGDEASLRVVGQSNLDTDAPGQLSITAEGLQLNGQPLDITLPAGGRVTVDYLAKALQTGTAFVTGSALSGQASDAMKLPLPILPHGIRSDIAWADSGNSNWVFSLPANTDLTSTGGTLYLTPSLAAAVSPALSYLAGYPYGCTEQTMSRFYPSVLAKQAGDLAKLPSDVAENLDDIVAKGLERIYTFQHNDGGWGFWQYDSSSPFITAYVVNGLLDAQSAGYPVRDYVLDNALNYLENAIVNEPIDDWRLVQADARAYAYYALAKAGRNAEGLSAVLSDKDLTPYGLALSVLTLNEYGDVEEANRQLDKLLAKAKNADSVAYWDTEAPRYYWNDDDTEATAYALEALVKLRPTDPIIPKVVNWLLLNREGSYWVSTKQTAAIVKSALALAKATGEETIDYQVVARLNGTEVLNQRMVGQSAKGVEVPLDKFMAGENKLELAITGQGTLYASANVYYFAEEDNYSPQIEHFRIKRTYEKLSPRLDPETQSYVYDRSLTIRDVKQGDYVLVTVELNPQADYRYVLVNDPLPAGFRVVEDDSVFRIAGVEPRYGYDWWGWNYWYDGREIHDERVDFYFTYLNDPVTFTYILRAETPGTYAALPTQAWLMYEPSIRGISNDAVLYVK